MSIDTTVSGGSANIAALGSINGAVTFLKNGSSTTENAAIGEIALKGKLLTTVGNTLTTIPVFCIDVYDWLGNGTFTQKDISSITSPNALGSSPKTVTSFSQAQLDSVLKLLVYTTTGASPKMTDAITSAATQMAVWEILAETSTNSWDLGAGDFKVGQYGGNDTQMSTAIADANSWLGTVKTGTVNTSGYGLSVWDPGVDNQRQIQLVQNTTSGGNTPTGAVPEPATWGMIVLGFGLLGGALRGRKRTSLYTA